MITGLDVRLPGLTQTADLVVDVCVVLLWQAQPLLVGGSTAGGFDERRSL